MLGLGLGIGVAQTAPLRRYSIGGKAPAVVADYSAGVYGLNGAPVGFDSLFSFSRLSAAWKRNALGHWVKALAGEPRTGHHIWKGGKLVPAGVAICSEVRTNLLLNSDSLSTQVVTVTAVEHTLSFTGTGTGTVTLSGAATDGPLIGTGAGEGNRVSLSFTPSAGSLTLTVSGDVQTAQLETGPYVTDYIPTGGAQVSTAAESSQIDPVSVAKAVGVFGPELWDDTATTLTGEAEDLGGGRYRIVSTTGSNSFVSVPNALSTLLGVLVLAEYTVESSTGEGVLAQNDGEMRTAPGRYSEIIIPDLNNAAIKRAGITDTVISNISYRKVTMPEELTFLIKGTMTYADEDSSTQVLFSRWLADSNNFIEIRLHTGLPSSTGDPFFLQSSLGAVSSKITNTSPYAPGTEVPFSLGFVLSATEIEGFYNGISTGTAAYGGMANLLSAPLQLFPVGNATIKDFRIWPEALPSADMLEATG